MPPAVVPELCQRLEVTLAEMEAADKNHDIPRYSMVDYEFHRTIWKFSGNEFLVRALEGVTMPLWAFSIIYFCRYRMKEDVDPMDLGLHRQMLNIIKSEAPIEEKQAGIRKILQTFQQKEQHDLSSRRNENSETTAPDEPASANSFQALAQNDHVR
jgi:DNA-binding GntR family transcriptional regulator